MSLNGETVTVNGKIFATDIRRDEHGSHSPQAVEAAASGGTSVNAQIPGNVWKILKNPGDDVAEGETILILEAMKMEIPVSAPGAGKVTHLEVAEGEQVVNGQELARVAC
jgi:biotin carboxyl carrier protein